MAANQLYVLAESLQNMMVSRATGGEEKPSEYTKFRTALMEEQSIAHLLPTFVQTCRTLDQWWGHISKQSPKYEGRRQYIWNAFAPLLDYLEKGNRAPADALVSDVLTKFDAEHVAAAWKKALDRRSTDAEGAITSARTLLESACKHILDEEGVGYNDKDDLPKLYRLTAEKLNIAPSQHTEEVFKQILGGCTAAVEGLGTLRNRLSDAHGKGKIAARPAPRHAELAVNLSGAIATFLLSTWEERLKLDDSWKNGYLNS